MAELKPYPFERHDLHQSQIEEVDRVYKYCEKIYAECLNIADEAIYKAVIRAAMDAGVTQIYLLDKQFVVDALTAALEKWRDGNDQT